MWNIFKKQTATDSGQPLISQTPVTVVLTDEIKAKLVDRYLEGSPVQDYVREEFDSLVEEAAILIIQNQIASTSLLQRRMKLGYNRAGRIMNDLEILGIVGPYAGSKARSVNLQAHDIEGVKILIDNFRIQVANFYQDNLTALEARRQGIEYKKQQQQIEEEKEAIRRDIIAKHEKQQEQERRKQLEREVYEDLKARALSRRIFRSRLEREYPRTLWTRFGTETEEDV
ncbi:hypothetical protein KRR40_12905 [Niabella defluvii]|nr:hypothetical protein KRR40_12905 [Niabella sp. I65]